jgi:hypothetical protein
MIHTPFRNYWDLALASVGRQLVAAASACADRGFSDHPSPVSLRAVCKLLKRARPVLSPRDAYANLDSGHKIQKEREPFQASLQWLQAEIRDLLPYTDEKLERKEILEVLALSAEDTELHFGTLTEGWDRLVAIKHQLLLPDDSLLARSAWLVSLMADFERSLKDAICLPIECLGRLEPIMKAASQIITEQGIKFEPNALLRHARTDSAVAQAISQSMAEGVATTLGVTSCFARHLGIKDFEGESFKRGFHVELEDLGSNSKDIILRLVELRRVILHNTTSVGNSSSNHVTMTSNFAPVDKWDAEQLKVIAQFLYSYSIHYTLAVMDVVSRTLIDAPKNGKNAQVARYKAALELHVGSLDLLKHKLWWLAWSLADYVRERYEGKDGLMLQLNAAFAQSKIDTPRDWKRKAREIEVTKKAAPRYHLLKKCILGEWAGISPLIKKAVIEGDMTLAELDSWPALEPLRARPEYNKAIAEFGKI